METIELNGHVIEVQEIHDTLPAVRFKLNKHWNKITEAFIPNITALEWFKRIGGNGFWNTEENKFASNSVLRRWIEQGAIRFNDKIVKPDTMLDFPILSLVLFPKSDTKRTTLV